MIKHWNTNATIFHEEESFTSFFLDKVWGEFSVGFMKTKYGKESSYKGLLIVDGSKYVTEIQKGDKVIPQHFDGTIEDFLALKPCEMYVASEITKHYLSNNLLTVEVLLT